MRPSTSDDESSNDEVVQAQSNRHYKMTGGNDEDSSSEGEGDDHSGKYDNDDDDEYGNDRVDDKDLPLSVRLQRQQESGVKRRVRLPKDKKEELEEVQAPQKKSSKHAPTEVSSKRADFFRRGAPNLDNSGIGISINAHRYQPRDPRMAVGAAANEGTSSTAAPQDDFLLDLRKKEIGELQRRVKAWKQPGKKGQRMRRTLGITTDSNSSLERDQAELQRLTQEQASYERAILEQRAKAKVQEAIQQRQPANSDKKYYPKRRELKQMQWQAKLDLLKQQDGGDNADEPASKPNAKQQTSSNKAVEKMVLKRRKRLKSKHAKKFL